MKVAKHVFDDSFCLNFRSFVDDAFIYSRLMMKSYQNFCYGKYWDFDEREEFSADDNLDTKTTSFPTLIVALKKFLETKMLQK